MNALKYLICLLLLSSFALARVNFERQSFLTSEFRDFGKLQETCAAPAAASFWCDMLDAELQLIPTKGADYFFNERGELVALFAKQQKGQDLRGRYSLDSGQNLIPVGAQVAGGAILFDGDYSLPEASEAVWERVDDTTLLGNFRYAFEDLSVEKTVVVSNVSLTLDVTTVVERLAAEVSQEAEVDLGEQVDDSADAIFETGEATLVQYALPGIAKRDTPIIKVGQGATFSINPVSQPVTDPNYIAFQTKNNSGNALILRAVGDSDGLAAQNLGNNVIAMQKTLAADLGSSVSLNLDVYGGPNELVRFDQEGYRELPGLFNPNILGRVSVGVLYLLERIHNVVGSWGLSIVVLTLIFRILIWPLITTQTKSMYGMQRLQPKIQALQKKYKDDREKLTQETMKLYKAEGVNPAGGCLPIILQMPLFIILWRVFANFEFNEGFLWIPDLGQADPTFILPILYVGIIVAQSYFMSQGNKQSLQQQLLINVVFVFFIISFPAGVTLYWVVSMLVQVVQYYLIRRGQPQPAKAT